MTKDQHRNAVVGRQLFSWIGFMNQLAAKLMSAVFAKVTCFNACLFVHPNSSVCPWLRIARWTEIMTNDLISYSEPLFPLEILPFPIILL